jgi:TonB family protein
MPITEIPPSPPSSSSPSPDGPLRGRRVRYEELDPEELFHVIDDLEGAKTRGRIREFIWISIIAHMLVFWYLAYGPRYFHRVRVVDQAGLIRQHQKDITSVDLADQLKKIKPRESRANEPAVKPPAAIHPRVDEKTLQHLREQQKTVPPPPQPEQPAPQMAQQQTPPPPAQPLPQNQQSLLEAPKPAARPAPTAPNFNTGPSTPGEAIRQAAQAAAQGQPTFGASSGSPNAPNGPGSAGGASIISDTMGVDFDPYLKRIVYDTERAWWPIIPEVARPPLNKQGRVLVRFKILKDGSVKSMQLEGPSGDTSLDRAAWGGITGAAPFPPLPKDFRGDFIELRFYFLYNIKPGVE